MVFILKEETSLSWLQIFVHIPLLCFLLLLSVNIVLGQVPHHHYLFCHQEVGFIFWFPEDVERVQRGCRLPGTGHSVAVGCLVWAQCRCGLLGTGAHFGCRLLGCRLSGTSAVCDCRIFLCHQAVGYLFCLVFLQLVPWRCGASGWWLPSMCAVWLQVAWNVSSVAEGSHVH